jgi:hypothetical protein
MAPFRALSILVCVACAALLLPGCDGQHLLQGLFGSHQLSLQTDELAPSGGTRAFGNEVADDTSEQLELASDAAEPKSSSRKPRKSGGKGVLSSIKSALTGKGRSNTRSRRKATGGVKVPKCPQHPFLRLSEQSRRDTPLKSWIAAGIQVRAQPFSYTRSV